MFQKKAKLAEEETEAQKGGAQQQSREQTRAHETAAKRKASTAHSAKHRKRQITRRSAVQSKASPTNPRAVALWDLRLNVASLTSTCFRIHCALQWPKSSEFHAVREDVAVLRRV